MTQQRKSFLRSLGPAFIVASVVLGPGSIVSASQVGATFGFRMIWLLAVAAALMIAMTALSARLGVTLRRTLCEEVSARVGRWLAVLIGLAVFAVATSFQFGNNLGIYTALEGIAPRVAGTYWPAVALVVINAGLIVFLYGPRDVYKWIERAMMVMVGVILVAFAANLVYLLLPVAARETAAAATPPPDLSANLIPRIERRPDGTRGIVDNWAPLVALMGTTFSVAGAFFQSYLVRQKGWTADDVRAGLVDTIAGISVLALITLVIMLTSAIALPGETIADAAHLAGQLKLFGTSAQILFCLGLFAAAFSSLLVNAAIGGSMLADGLGLGGLLEQRWTKAFTVVALAVGLGIALAMKLTELGSPVPLILFAQAVTVLAWPLLAGVLLWLALRTLRATAGAPPKWMWTLCAGGMLLALVLAPRTAYLIYLRLSLG